MGADVGLLHATLVGAHVVTHAVLPLEALLTDGAGVGLLVRVGQAVPVQVVHVPEGLPAGFAGVVLAYRVRVRGSLRHREASEPALNHCLHRHRSALPEIRHTQPQRLCAPLAVINIDRHHLTGQGNEGELLLKPTRTFTTLRRNLATSLLGLTKTINQPPVSSKLLGGLRARVLHTHAECQRHRPS